MIIIPYSIFQWDHKHPHDDPANHHHYIYLCYFLVFCVLVLSNICLELSLHVAIHLTRLLHEIVRLTIHGLILHNRSRARDFLSLLITALLTQ